MMHMVRASSDDGGANNIHPLCCIVKSMPKQLVKIVALPFAYKGQSICIIIIEWKSPIKYQYDYTKINSVMIYALSVNAGKYFSTNVGYSISCFCSQ